MEREKWAHRLVLCGLDRPTHSGVKAEEEKKSCRVENVKNKFHVKLGNYSEVRTFEEDTTAKKNASFGAFMAHNGNERLASFSTPTPLTRWCERLYFWLSVLPHGEWVTKHTHHECTVTVIQNRRQRNESASSYLLYKSNATQFFYFKHRISDIIWIACIDL